MEVEVEVMVILQVLQVQMVVLEVVVVVLTEVLVVLVVLVTLQAHLLVKETMVEQVLQMPLHQIIYLKVVVEVEQVQ